MLTAQQWAEKWGRKAKAAGADMKTGVEGVTVAPGVKAAAKAQKFLAGITEAVASGKWQRNVAGVSLEEWKRTMLDKGVQRVGAGVDAAMGRMQQVGEQLMGQIANVKQVIDKMPDDTYEQRVDRMLKNAELMRKIKITV